MSGGSSDASQTWRGLLVEDSADDALLIELELRRTWPNIELERVDEEADFRQALTRGPWHLVLSDWSMPRFSALGALRICQESGLDLPFIIVSGTIGEESAVEAMRAGAHDYVIKDKLLRLVPAIERELRECTVRAARQRAEADLRESEARYRRIVETTSEGIWTIDAEQRTTFVNRRMADILGYEPHELIGGKAFDLLDADEREKAVAGLERRRAGISEQRQVRLRRRDGSHVFVLMETGPVFDADGKFDGVLAMAMDISDRRRSEEALAERANIAALTAKVGMALTRTDSLREVLQSCAEAIVHHLDGAFARIWTLNAVEKVLDLQASAGLYVHLDGPHARIPIGSLKIGLIAAERRPHLSNRVQDDPHFSDHAWARREGIVAFAGHPLLVAGRLIGVLAMFATKPLTDATLRALAVIADAVAVGIHSKFVERERAALESQLRQAQKMDAVGRLAGGVAHDFNNLLSVILSYADLLGDAFPDADDPNRADLDEITKAAHRAADLTRQLLMFSRQQVMEPKVLDPSAVLAGMENMLLRLVGEDIRLTMVRSEKVDNITIDPGHLQQVIMNLVVNARDAIATGSQTGQVTLEASNIFLDDVYAQDHLGVVPGRYVLLAVTDTGAGIDKATQARIFEPFFSTKEKGKGTGLGLSMVFGIVKQAGGSIWVYSEPGRGTTFKVYFPSTDGHVDPVRAPTAPTTLRGTETILLVEDEDQVRLVAHGILKKNGYHVMQAQNGAEALALSGSYAGKIDLLLTDVVMPQMSGPELARRLLDLRPEIKVLCMSGYTDDTVVRHGGLDPEVAFLQKPITPDSLSRKVREVLG